MTHLVTISMLKVAAEKLETQRIRLYDIVQRNEDQPMSKQMRRAIEHVEWSIAHLNSAMRHIYKERSK